jgi:hypothetical protein
VLRFPKIYSVVQTHPKTHVKVAWHNLADTLLFYRLYDHFVKRNHGHGGKYLVLYVRVHMQNADGMDPIVI